MCKIWETTVYLTDGRSFVFRTINFSEDAVERLNEICEAERWVRVIAKKRGYAVASTTTLLIDAPEGFWKPTKEVVSIFSEDT